MAQEEKNFQDAPDTLSEMEVWDETKGSVTLTKLSIDHYIFFKRHIGVDGLRIHGIQGTGKSNLGNSIVGRCLLENDENFVLIGDVACEWLNVAQYAKKITLILPKDKTDNFEGIDKDDPNYRKRYPIFFTENLDFIIENFNIEPKYVEYEKLDIMEYFEESSKGEIVVIYDEHFLEDWSARINFWSGILKQILFRTILLRRAIGMLFHEAGNYFPFAGFDEKHSKAIKRFAKLFVHARKFLARLIFISQMENEMINLIRDKCFWIIYRKGFYKYVTHDAIHIVGLKLSLDKYILWFSGVFTLDNQAQKIDDINAESKMVPKNIKSPKYKFDIDEEEEDLENIIPENLDQYNKERDDKRILLAIDCGINYRDIHAVFGKSLGYISKLANE